MIKLPVLSLHNNEYATPKYLYDFIMSFNVIDPCYLGCKEIAYFIDYNNVNIYINPPFDQKKEFVSWCYRLIDNNCKVLLLLPLQCSSVYHWLFNNADIVLFNHRLKFNDCKNAPFDCVLFFLKKNMDHNICVLSDYEIFKKIEFFFNKA